MPVGVTDTGERQRKFKLAYLAKKWYFSLELSQNRLLLLSSCEHTDQPECSLKNIGLNWAGGHKVPVKHSEGHMWRPQQQDS